MKCFQYMTANCLAIPPRRAKQKADLRAARLSAKVCLHHWKQRGPGTQPKAFITTCPGASEQLRSKSTLPSKFVCVRASAACFHCAKARTVRRPEMVYRHVLPLTLRRAAAAKFLALPAPLGLTLSVPLAVLSRSLVAILHMQPLQCRVVRTFGLRLLAVDQLAV